MAADDDTARFDGWDRVPMALASFAIGDRKCIENFNDANIGTR